MPPGIGIRRATPGSFSTEEGGRRPPGRPKGSLNKVKQEIRELANKMLNDPIYLRNLQSRLRFGECPASVEITLYHYAYGAPAKTLLVKDQRAPLSFLTFHEIGVYDPLASLRISGARAIPWQGPPEEPLICSPANAERRQWVQAALNSSTRFLGIATAGRWQEPFLQAE